MAASYFTGGNEGKGHRLAAQRIARGLARNHPTLGYSILFSAASYVLRDGRNPTDSVVLEEARRRSTQLETAVANRERRFGR